ncbi:hypothetical protein [Amycolatopsis sp. DSM 110486]|nr:hypothetical protein [Amycolatopsis sp. DSM 110486]QYN23140.1 hypothetical protein K1T34_12180 [Amycolatopsis sp. DSM 110486]
MAKKDHKVTISRVGRPKETRMVTEQEANTLETLPFRDPKVISVTVTPPR